MFGTNTLSNRSINLPRAKYNTAIAIQKVELRFSWRDRSVSVKATEHRTESSNRNSGTGIISQSRYWVEVGSLKKQSLPPQSSAG